MAYIEKLNFNSSSYPIRAIALCSAVCGTAAGTAAKTVSARNFVLDDGATIVVKFSNTNTAASPTLNVNSTGAKAIQYRGNAIQDGLLKAGGVYQFVYDADKQVYNFVGDINTNTDTKNTTGSTNDTTNALFIIGATTLAANPVTYSNSNVKITSASAIQATGYWVTEAAQIVYDTTSKSIKFIFA